MGFRNTGNRVPRMSSAALSAVLAEAARSEPYKIVGRKVGLSDRQIRNIAKGATDTAASTALAFAQHYPQVRQFFARVLALETLDPRTEALLKSMREWQAAQPEEGDRANE